MTFVATTDPNGLIEECNDDNNEDTDTAECGGIN
jgi:hypothetical protein